MATKEPLVAQREPIATTERALNDMLVTKYSATRRDVRVWHVPVPERGVIRLFCKLNPRYCTVSVERLYNHGRDGGRLHLSEGKGVADCETVMWPWFTEHVWPHVGGKDGEHTGGSGGEFFRGIERTALLGVLDEWLTQERVWGIRCDQVGYCIFCDQDPFRES